MAKQAITQTALLPAGDYIGLVSSVNRDIQTTTGTQTIFEMDVPGYRGLDIAIFDQKAEPSPALAGIKAGDVIRFKTKHRTKVDPNTGKEATRAFHSPIISDAALDAAIAAAAV